MSEENNNAETTAVTRTFKSVNGKSLDGSQGELKFISASKLSKEGITGIVAEGIFEGTKMVDGKFGAKPEYRVRSEDGTLLIVSGGGSLDKQMSKVPAGTYIQITYLGKKPMENGQFKGTLSHSFVVGIAE